MRTSFDFSPLFRSTIGFDRMLGALEAASRVETIENWPPYDILKAGEEDYRITMAVAGFDRSELAITHDRNLLLVTGKKAGGQEGNYLHRGISRRDFERRFELADHVKIIGAELSNGLLTIELKRELPEEKKPRQIPIEVLQQSGVRQIEATKQAA